MSGFDGTLALVRLALRRDRLRIPLWVVAIAGITYASGAAISGVYDDRASIEGYAALVGSSPVTVAMGGPPVGLDTLAGIVVYETSFTAIVGVSVMAVMMMSRHTRGEEESGRSELIRSAEVGRHAGGAAALLVTTGASVLLGLLLWAALAPTALTVHQAALFGAGIALLGTVHAAATLVLAQLFVHARTVTGAGLAVFGVGYVLRAAGDVREDWLVWLSPVGWVQATHVPTAERWWPLLLPALATVLLVVLADALADRRDFAAGLVPARAGRPTASPALSGPFGLGLRTQRTAVVAWGVGLLLLAVVTGTLGSSMQEMIESNPTMAEYLQVTGGSVIDSYVATMVLILALVVGGFAVWSANHPGADEDEDQLELVLAGPLDRTRSLLADVAVTVAATTVVLLLTATGFGVAHGVVMDDPSEGWRAAGAQLAYWPAVLTLVGLVVLVRGWLPRWSWVGWVVLAFSAVIGWLGGLLQPPEWVADLSPFSHVPEVPVESAAGAALPVLTVVAALLVAVGVVGFRRRDIG